MQNDDQVEYLCQIHDACIRALIAICTWRTKYITCRLPLIRHGPQRNPSSVLVVNLVVKDDWIVHKNKTSAQWNQDEIASSL